MRVATLILLLLYPFVSSAQTPETILFAPDGTILARGLTIDELKAKLEEIFEDK